MTLMGVKCVLGYKDMQFHEECMSESGSPPCGFSTTVLNLMLKPNKEREGVQFSPSSLAACHRRTILGRRYDWYLGIRETYSMIRGTVIHEGLSREPEPLGSLGVIRELRLETPINVDGVDQPFKGKADEVVLLSVQNELINTGLGNTVEHSNLQRGNVLHVRLVDHKTKATLPPSFTEPYKDNIYQVNAYSYLLEQALPAWISSAIDGWSPGLFSSEAAEYMQLAPGVVLPHIDKVVVDEMVLAYMSMDGMRTFSSRGFRYEVGKSGQQLELSPIQHFESAFTKQKIRDGIKRQIEAETMLAPPLEADRAYIMCGNCPMRKQCIETGLAEGHNMYQQQRYE